MRLLIIIMTLVCVSTTPAFSAKDAQFDTFMKSREVVATLYFQSNSDGLTKQEKNRLEETIAELRKLQKNGRLIRVEGFSSPEGDQEKNFHLSFFRARAVADLIEAGGMPAEVTLTGYGDLLAKSTDPDRERRVEIASYIRPAGVKRVKVADTTGGASDESTVAPAENEIDSYRVDQAIRRKIDDRNKGIADKVDEKDSEATPGVSQSTGDTVEEELERGYSQWRKSVDPDFSPKLSQSKQDAEAEPKRRYSQWGKDIDPAASPGLSQVTPVQAPIIDALMIEQAIMEKIGTEPPAPTGAVTRVDPAY